MPLLFSMRMPKLSLCKVGQFFMTVRMANKRVVTPLRIANEMAIMAAAW